jgi:hypothetical protein
LISIFKPAKISLNIAAGFHHAPDTFVLFLASYHEEIDEWKEKQAFGNFIFFSFLCLVDFHSSQADGHVMISKYKPPTSV